VTGEMVETSEMEKRKREISQKLKEVGNVRIFRNL